MEGKRPAVGVMRTVRPGPGQGQPRKPQPPQPPKSKWARLKGRFGSFLFQLISLALFLTALGIWGYTQVMKQILGRFDVFDWQSAAVTLYGAPNVLIIDPVRTEEFLRPDTTVYDTLWPYYHRFDPWPLADTNWYAGEMRRPKAAAFEAWQLLGTPDSRQNVRLVDYWKELLFQHNISFRIMEEPGLTALPDDVNMVVLPGCLLLSNDEKLGVKRFVAKGGKLMLCWSAGVRDENGSWVGYDFLQQMLGGMLAGQAADVAGGTAFILSGSGPITAMIPPGEHLEFFTYNGFVGMNLVEPRMTSDAWWFQPYWHNAGRSAVSTPTFVAHGSYVAGKVVWFSFTPDAVQPHKDNGLILQKMILNGFSWLSGKPLVDIRVWPGGYTAGGAVVVEGVGAPETVLRLAQRLKDVGQEFDLIINPETVGDRFSLSSNDFGDLIMAGTDTSMLNSHNDNQFDWVEKGIARLERIVGRKPNGIAAPIWGYGTAFGLAAARNEISFILGHPQQRYYGPTDQVIRTSGWWIFAQYRNLATLPKCQVSADEWVTYGGIKGGSELLGAMEQDLRRIRKAGGLYTAILNPSTLEEENAFDVAQKLPAMMDSLGVWKAPLRTLIERVSGWEGLRVTMLEVTQTRLRLDVSNESNVSLRDVTFEMYFAPDVVSNVEVTAQLVGFRPGNVVVDHHAGSCRFTVPEIASGVNTSMFVDLAPSETSTPAVEDTLQ